MMSPLPIRTCVLLAAMAAGVSAQTTTQEALNRIRTDLFTRAEHLDEDVRGLKQILAADPRSAEAHVLLGIAYRAIGSEELIGESVAEFRQALDLDPALVPVRFYLARVYVDLGRFSRAREELETALERAPGNPEFLALLGETERQLKNPARAVELTRQALRANESFAQARYYLGLALYDLGRRDEAITELERVVASGPAAADPYLALGTAYLEAKRVAEAQQTLMKGVRIDAKRPELHIQLARAYRLDGMLDKAAAELALAAPAAAAASDQAPGMTAYQRQQVDLDFYLERGRVRLQRGQLTAAAADFKKVLEMDANQDEAKRGLAEANRRLHKKSEAPQ